jgi:hypothetical protein
VSTTTQVIKEVTPPVIRSLYEQGGKSSSIFIRIAGISGATAVALGNLRLCHNLNSEIIIKLTLFRCLWCT